MRRLLVTMLAAASLWASPGLAENGYPSRPITLIVPYAAGGPSDVIARLLGQSMSVTLGQQLVIENVAGAGGTAGAARAAAAEPDGYTLLIHHVALAAGSVLYGHLRYDTLHAFAPIGLVNYGPFVLTSKLDLPVQDIAGALDYIRRNGEKVTMAHAGVGSGSHLCNMLLQSALGVKVTEVAYRGTGPAMNDLVGGQVEMLCDQTTNAIPQIEGKRIKAFAVTSVERNAQLPDLPTMSEAGLDRFELVQWHALYASQGTPKPVVAKLAAALERALGETSVIDRFAELGTVPYPAGHRGPNEAGVKLSSEVERWGRLIRAAGFKPK